MPSAKRFGDQLGAVVGVQERVNLAQRPRASFCGRSFDRFRRIEAGNALASDTTPGTRLAASSISLNGRQFISSVRGTATPLDSCIGHVRITAGVHPLCMASRLGYTPHRFSAKEALPCKIACFPKQNYEDEKRSVDRLPKLSRAGERKSQADRETHVQRILSMHDLYRNWTTALLSEIGKRFGDQALDEIMH